MNINLRLVCFLFAFALLVPFTPSVTDADILNWQTGETIPGTEGVVPGPGKNLSGRNTDDRNLRFADFQGLQLSDASFSVSWLHNARFSQANLENASFASRTFF